MDIVQAWIGARAKDSTAIGAASIVDYLRRSSRFCPCGKQSFTDEAGFWEWAASKDTRQARLRTFTVLLDGRGCQMSSEKFADKLRELRDGGVRRLVLAIGPPSGWSAESQGKADLVLSFGLMTLPHELARVVLAEQVYRALTILAGHPYHLGH